MQSFKAFVEAMTMQQRMKAKASFRRNKSKIKIGRKRAERRVATPEKLKVRAQKVARKRFEKRFLGDKSKNDLSYGAREALEKRLDKKQAAIGKLAKRLVPLMRKKELERKRNKNNPKSSESEK